MDAIARGCASKKEQEKADRLVISKSNLFDIGFFTCPFSQENQHDPIRIISALTPAALGLGKRYPDFIPESTQSITIQTDVIRWRTTWTAESRQDHGPSKLFSPGRLPAEKSMRVALHLHLYYHEMAEEILDRLRGFVAGWISSSACPDRWRLRRLKSIFGGYSQGRVDIRVFNNRGRDIGPFLTGFGETILNGYDIIGHIHTKKSDNTGINAESMAQAVEALPLRQSLSRQRNDGRYNHPTLRCGRFDRFGVS